MRFAERIECAIVEYHARDCVDRARFVNGVFDIALVYFVVVRRIRDTEGGELERHIYKCGAEHKADKHRGGVIQRVKALYHTVNELPFGMDGEHAVDQAYICFFAFVVCIAYDFGRAVADFISRVD